jgi:hypothetical protein
MPPDASSIKGQNACTGSMQTITSAKQKGLKMIIINKAV